jgi:hypothetical protein
MDKTMRIENTKKNIISLMRDVWQKKLPVIFWYSDKEGKKVILETEVVYFDQYYFFCSLDKEKKLFFAQQPEDLYFYCEKKDLSFKVEFSFEKEQIHFTLPFKAAVPELRQGQRFRFPEKDLNLITIKNKEKIVESYNALDISYNGFSFLVNEKDLEAFKVGDEIQVSSLPFSRDVVFFNFTVKSQAEVYKQTLTKGAVFRIGAEFSAQKPSLNIPFVTEAPCAGGEVIASKTLNEKQLSAELSSTFFRDVDQRVKRIFSQHLASEEKLFWAVHQLSAYILKHQKAFIIELNKLSSEDLFSLLQCSSSILLKKYLLVMDQRHRHYFYQNVLKSVPLEKMLEVQRHFLNFVQVSKAA